MVAKNKTRFKAGDRVRCKRGPAKGHAGVVCLRPGLNGVSISPRPGFVNVLFDGMKGTILEAHESAIEKVRKA